MAAEERGVTKRFSKVCPCEACKRGRGAPHKIMPKRINEYSGQPDEGWRPQMTLPEIVAVRNGAPKPWFMGVELETQAPTYRYAGPTDAPIPIQPPEPYPYDGPEHDAYMDAYEAWLREYRIVIAQNNLARQIYANTVMDEHVTAEQIVSMARPRPFWYPKHDGSVSGPEFASLPATLAWWYSRRESFEYMLTTMLHAGVRSHMGDKCGFHVNISFTAFDNAGHLARFAMLINMNPSWSQRMSQRTENSLHWSEIGSSEFRRAHDIERWAIYMFSRGHTSADRYNALNGPGNGRIEFRLPRGTLRIDRFYKNLEWVHAMVEYTRSYADTSSSTFMRWVMCQDNYPELQAWITEKFGIARGEEPFAPRLVELDASDALSITAGEDVLCEWRPQSPHSGRSGRCPCGDGCDWMNCGSCEDSGINGYPCRVCGLSEDECDCNDEDDMDVEPCECNDGCARGACGSCLTTAARASVATARASSAAAQGSILGDFMFTRPTNT